jgi:hypothetical protein
MEFEMKEYSTHHIVKNRKAIVIPVFSTLPDPLEIGEMVYKQDVQFPGLYIYTGDKKWVCIMTPKNNIIEEHIATHHQKLFTLTNSYPTDGISINVYVNGKRLQKNEIAEIGTNQVIIKEDEFLQEGDRVEFQIFNVYEERTVSMRPNI